MAQPIRAALSYTEKEVRHALDSGLPVLTFIINNSANWPHTAYEDAPDKKVCESRKAQEEMIWKSRKDRLISGLEGRKGFFQSRF